MPRHRIHSVRCAEAAILAQQELPPGQHEEHRAIRAQRYLPADLDRFVRVPCRSIGCPVRRACSLEGRSTRVVVVVMVMRLMMLMLMLRSAYSPCAARKP